MLFKRYTKEQLVEAVQTSTSIRQVLIKLNIDAYGGNYHTINKYIKELGLDTSHFLGQGWNKGNSPNIYQDRTIQDYLDNKYIIGSNQLKQRLFRENYFEKKCYKCGLTEWNGQPISLELEHIDGNHHNNNLSNLTILCPNCHAQTSTYRGKNIK